jgi:hypothetical protein
MAIIKKKKAKKKQMLKRMWRKQELSCTVGWVVN